MGCGDLNFSAISSSNGVPSYHTWKTQRPRIEKTVTQNRKWFGSNFLF